MSEPTKSLTPGEWFSLTKVELWSGQTGDIGHCHNLLEQWAEQIVDLQSALAACHVALESRTVYEFSEGKIPVFRQGEVGRQQHELEEVVTAERCTGMVSIIVQLREENEILREGLRREHQPSYLPPTARG